GLVVSASAEVRRLTTPQDLFQAAAEEFLRIASEAIAQRGRFTVALAGGSTPKNLYALIAANASTTLPWDKMFFFWGDERHVPPDNPDSNYRMANEALLSKVPVPAANIFRVPTENPDASAAAAAYEQTLRKFFDVAAGEFPRFDLILLGMGPDGHTASLFPETAALNEKVRLVVANWVEKFHSYRITFTLPVLNHAACDMFLVSGKDKADMVRRVLADQNADLPSQKVHPADGGLLWLL